MGGANDTTGLEGEIEEGCNALAEPLLLQMYFTDGDDVAERPPLHVVYEGKRCLLRMSTLARGVIVFENGINTLMLQEHPELNFDIESEEALKAFEVRRSEGRPVTSGPCGLNMDFSSSTVIDARRGIMDNQTIIQLFDAIETWNKRHHQMPPYISKNEYIFFEESIAPVKRLADIFSILRGVRYQIEENDPNHPTANMALTDPSYEIVKKVSLRLAGILNNTFAVRQYLEGSVGYDLRLVLSDFNQSAPRVSFAAMDNARLVRVPKS
jgi:hypothetical protein